LRRRGRRPHRAKGRRKKGGRRNRQNRRTGRPNAHRFPSAFHARFVGFVGIVDFVDQAAAHRS
jgi:hypothetical protein